MWQIARPKLNNPLDVLATTQPTKRDMTKTPRFISTATSFLIALAFAGCVISGGNRVPGASYPPTNPDNVTVLYQEPTRPYQVIGFVSVDRAIAGKDSVIERKFRTVAASMGADAVLIDMLPKASFAGAPVQGRAKAIRWKRNSNPLKT